MSSFLFTNHSFRPRYQSRPYQTNPGRREHIHGKVQGLPNHSKLADALVVAGWTCCIIGLTMLASPYQKEGLAIVAVGFFIAAIGAAKSQ